MSAPCSRSDSPNAKTPPVASNFPTSAFASALSLIQTGPSPSTVTCHAYQCSSEYQASSSLKSLLRAVSQRAVAAPASPPTSRPTAAGVPKVAKIPSRSSMARKSVYQTASWHSCLRASWPLDSKKSRTASSAARVRSS